MTIQNTCFLILGLLLFYIITIPLLQAIYKKVKGRKLHWFDAFGYISGGVISIALISFILIFFVYGLLGKLD